MKECAGRVTSAGDRCEAASISSYLPTYPTYLPSLFRSFILSRLHQFPMLTRTILSVLPAALCTDQAGAASAQVLCTYAYHRVFSFDCTSLPSAFCSSLLASSRSSTAPSLLSITYLPCRRQRLDVLHSKLELNKLDPPIRGALLFFLFLFCFFFFLEFYFI